MWYTQMKIGYVVVVRFYDWPLRNYMVFPPLTIACQTDWFCKKKKKLTIFLFEYCLTIHNKWLTDPSVIAPTFSFINDTRRPRRFRSITNWHLRPITIFFSNVMRRFIVIFKFKTTRHNCITRPMLYSRSLWTVSSILRECKRT